MVDLAELGTQVNFARAAGLSRERPDHHLPDGATAAAHGLIPTSVKRLLYIAGARRTSPTRRATKATSAATHP